MAELSKKEKDVKERSKDVKEEERRKERNERKWLGHLAKIMLFFSVWR